MGDWLQGVKMCVGSEEREEVSSFYFTHYRVSIDLILDMSVIGVVDVVGSQGQRSSQKVHPAGSKLSNHSRIVGIHDGQVVSLAEN
jgi:hypothetical protein